MHTKSNADTRAEIVSALEYAPAVGTSIADGLLAVTLNDLTVCYKCLGRLYARGMGHLVRGGSQVWSDQVMSGKAITCDTCGHFEVAE